ncbi:MAG: hypothetical protein P8Y18_05290, partial [Candidatus Bathyarchaeota archaeon]
KVNREISSVSFQRQGGGGALNFNPKPTLIFSSYKEKYKFNYNITVNLIINGDVSCVATDEKNAVNKTTTNFNNTSGLFIAQQGGL